MATKLLTVHEAAEAFRVSRATLFRWARVGRIRFVKLGVRSNRVKASDVDALIEKGTR